MASTISITVGAVTATRTFSATDTKVRDTLLAYYTALGLVAATETNAAKLSAILDYWVNQAKYRATQYRVEQVSTDAVAAAKAEFEVD